METPTVKCFGENLTRETGETKISNEKRPFVSETDFLRRIRGQLKAGANGHTKALQMVERRLITLGERQL